MFVRCISDGQSIVLGSILSLYLRVGSWWLAQVSRLVGHECFIHSPSRSSLLGLRWWLIIRHLSCFLVEKAWVVYYPSEWKITLIVLSCCQKHIQVKLSSKIGWKPCPLRTLTNDEVGWWGWREQEQWCQQVLSSVFWPEGGSSQSQILCAAVEVGRRNRRWMDSFCPVQEHSSGCRS